MKTDQKLCHIARQAIEDCLGHHQTDPQFPRFSEHAEHASGVFVTLWDIHNKKKELRGCIGRHVRRFPQSIAQEVADCAILSATEDDRFTPLTLEECPHINIEISLLSPLEECQEKDLDAKKYGIVIRSGFRSATLLPDIEGVESVTQQLAITRRKAGIGPHEPIQISRFSIIKLQEDL